MFTKGYTGNGLTYPVTQEILDNLDPSRLVNPQVGNSHGLKIPDDFDVIRSSEEIQTLRDEMKMGNVSVAQDFMEKYYPFDGEYEFPEALAMMGLSIKDPDGLANIVHMDMPVDAPLAALRWLTKYGYNVKKHTDDHINFLETIPHTIENIADGVKKALNEGFAAKYYFGISRPEEILGDNMTAYPEGCPNHPSFPAGHGAAVAGGVRRLMRDFNVDEKCTKQMLDLAYTFAMARSLAGVHHAIDNIAGLAVGGLDKYFTDEWKNKILA